MKKKLTLFFLTLISLSLNAQDVGSITIVNIDSSDPNTRVNGASYVVLDNNDEVVAQPMILQDGTVVVENLSPGRYYVSEANPAIGYEPMDEDDERLARVVKNDTKKVTFSSYKMTNMPDVPDRFTWYFGRYLFEDRYPVETIRVGEYYWMAHNFKVECDRNPWFSVPGNIPGRPSWFYFPAMYPQFLDKYKDCIKLPNHDMLPITTDEFNEYYGFYTNRDGIASIGEGITWTVEDKTKTDGMYILPYNRQLWGLPTREDVRQLFSMCTPNIETGVLGEMDVRKDLAPKENLDSPALRNLFWSNMVHNEQKNLGIYWFAADNTDKYGFNLMPNGYRMIERPDYWTNGLGDINNGSITNGWESDMGDLALTFYTAWFPVRDRVNDLHDGATGLVYLHDSISSTANTWVDRRYSFRWCRRLTDEELGYKLYIKVNNISADKWASLKNDLATSGEASLLRELVNGRVKSEDLSIVRTTVSKPQPEDYVELPQGYIRGYYVQFMIYKPNPNFSVDQIGYLITKIRDEYVQNMKEQTGSRSLAIAADEVKDIEFYPNPIENTMYIKGFQNIQSLQIYNTAGKLVYSTQKLHTNSIDLSHLSPEVYIINAQTDKGTHSYKILKK